MVLPPDGAGVAAGGAGDAGDDGSLLLVPVVGVVTAPSLSPPVVGVMICVIRRTAAATPP